MKKEIESFWVTKDGVEEYNKKRYLKYLWNFLFWKRENESALLIVGDGDYGDKNDSSYEKLVECFKNNGRIVPEHKPDGIGIFQKGSQFNGVYFERTPENLRPVILDALGLL